MSIRRELFARDKSLFRLYVTPIFEEYLKILEYTSDEFFSTDVTDVTKER